MTTEILNYINILASLIIMIISLCLLFQHFADHRSKLEQALKIWQYRTFKIGLTFMAMGTLWNIFKVDKTPASEIILNVGLAVFMAILCCAFNRLFICKDKKSSKDIYADGYTIDPTDGDPLPDDTEN